VRRVRVAVEGQLDFAVAERRLSGSGLTAVRVGLPRGRSEVLSRWGGYNEAAKREPWLVLVDLDRDECAPSLLRSLPSAPVPRMALRIAVREIEAWLLADRSIARALRVPANALPSFPDHVDAPKRRLVELVRAECKTKQIRDAILPAQAPARVGRGYNNFLAAFVRERWEPAAAAKRSDSLARALRAIERLAGH